MDKIRNYLTLIRVKHYIKNFLVFLPFIFSGKLFEVKSFFLCLIGFFVFSFVCSIVYIVNDIKDIDKDRLHFKKKNRPLASGKVSIKEAVILIFILFIMICVGLFFLNAPLISIIYLFLYLSLNLLYSFGLKNVPIVDIVILTSGFVIRVLFGASIIGVVVSNWLNLTIMSVSFYLALGKRRNEIINNRSKKKTRDVLKYYNKDFLDKNMYMFLSLGLVFYSLWTIDLKIMNKTSEYLIWTVPVVMIIFMRYSMIVENESDGDPVEVVCHDKVLLLLGLIYGVLLISLLYFI